VASNLPPSTIAWNENCRSLEKVGASDVVATLRALTKTIDVCKCLLPDGLNATSLNR
jgi:hypothetical protein